jgi:hypothetical protein
VSDNLPFTKEWLKYPNNGPLSTSKKVWYTCTGMPSSPGVFLDLKPVIASSSSSVLSHESFCMAVNLALLIGKKIHTISFS